MIRTAILTVSDSCAAGRMQDAGGPAIAEMLDAALYEVCAAKVVPDDAGAIRNELKMFCDVEAVDMVLTTGGTGFGPRDVTPEATAEVCERLAPGLGELMRAEGLRHTPTAALSRAVAGIRGRTLIINLPGSPKGVRESLAAILGVLPHAARMMAGGGH